MSRYPTESSLGLCCLLALVSLGCGASGDAPPAETADLGSAPPNSQMEETQAERAPAVPPPELPPRFFDVTDETGVDWVHNTGAFGERWLPETMGPGVLIFDADGDQRLDLLLVNGRNFPGRPGAATLPGLYLNQGDLRFREVPDAAGLEAGYCLGGAAADFDNDGDTDLYLTCVGRDRLLRNDGGRFTDVSRSAGLVDEYEFGSGAVFFDADRDGWLDLYAARYVVWTPETDLPCSLYGEGKSYCTPSIYEGVSGRFYRNRGDGTFEERTRPAGLWMPEAKALGVIAADLDGDGWSDLVVACDTVRNLLFHNNGDGTFEEIGLTSGIATAVDGRPRGGMGIELGDFEGSGRPGFLITYFVDEMVGLYQNLGEQFFIDTAPRFELGRRTLLTLGWGALFFDYDFDGWFDLLVANGHLDRKVDLLPDGPRWAQPQQLFQNRGGGEFFDVTDTVGGDLAEPLVGRGAAFGDLDDDGDLDVVITANGGPAKVFENRSESGHWLRVDLEGRRSNRDAIGATVTVRTASKNRSWQLRTGGSYLSQSQISPVFGLGQAETADEVVVQWPSGVVQRVANVAANRQLALVEPAEESTP